MDSGTHTLDAAGILAAEAEVLTRAIEWDHLHVVEDLDDAAALVDRSGARHRDPDRRPGLPTGERVRLRRRCRTSSDNLDCLCHLHHRLKTRGGWSYQMLDLGVYLWRSPYGYLYRRDRDGTVDLTPPPVDPPDQPSDPPEQ